MPANLKKKISVDHQVIAASGYGLTKMLKLVT